MGCLVIAAGCLNDSYCCCSDLRCLRSWCACFALATYIHVDESFASSGAVDCSLLRFDRFGAFFGMAVLQHNWTGYVAIHASYTSTAFCLSQPVKGVTTGKGQNSSSRGAWLKANSHARLRLHAGDGKQPCMLSLHIQEHVLLQRELDQGQLKLAVQPCQQTSVLVLAPRLQVG